MVKLLHRPILSHSGFQKWTDFNSEHPGRLYDRGRDKDRIRETDRQTEIEREIDRQTDRQMEIERDRQEDRWAEGGMSR